MAILEGCYTSAPSRGQKIATISVTESEQHQEASRCLVCKRCWCSLLREQKVTWATKSGGTHQNGCSIRTNPITWGRSHWFQVKGPNQRSYRGQWRDSQHLEGKPTPNRVVASSEFLLCQPSFGKVWELRTLETGAFTWNRQTVVGGILRWLTHGLLQKIVSRLNCK